MLVIYVLTKAKELKVKIIRDTKSGMFQYRDYEYRIDRKRIYQKRFLNFKTFFFSFYLEGNPIPLEFDDKDYNVSMTDVPLDEIAVILRKIRRGLSDIIMILVGVGSLLGIIYVIWFLHNYMGV
jgi:hypothetical protein